MGTKGVEVNLSSVCWVYNEEDKMFYAESIV